jgi:hypothetical protein
LAKGVLHNLLPPAVFSLALFAHLGALTNHYFIAQDIRHMLR